MRTVGKRGYKPRQGVDSGYSATSVVSPFSVVQVNEKSVKVYFQDYGLTWSIPKSQIVDERFGVGRTPPESGDNLEVSSWYFAKELRFRLKPYCKD